MMTALGLLGPLGGCWRTSLKSVFLKKESIINTMSDKAAGPSTLKLVSVTMWGLPADRKIDGFALCLLPPVYLTVPSVAPKLDFLCCASFLDHTTHAPLLHRPVWCLLGMRVTPSTTSSSQQQLPHGRAGVSCGPHEP